MKYKTLKISILALGGTLIGFANAPAATLGDLSHIHNIKAMKSQVLLGTHEGLFLYLGKNKIKKISAENLDFMGLTVNGATLFASGHPSSGSSLPQPMGVISSVDMGKTWKPVVLQGKVDFHMFEASGSDLYGVDAQTGNLLYSDSLGKNWINIGSNKYEDIAISIKQKGTAFGLVKGVLYKTTNGFKSATKLKSDLKFTGVESLGNQIFATVKNSVYLSLDDANSWKKISTIKNDISVLSVSSEILVLADSQRLYISKDGGKTFTE